MLQTLCNEIKSHEANEKWIEIANKIKVIRDEVLDYHPQFEGYVMGTEIKQADTILIGYPLMFAMNESTRRNDLNFYANCTAKSGPAMTYSMFAINHLDIGDVKDANEMLMKSYKPYIRAPFNVWSEVVEGEEFAANFITGAGGFLQAIFNGFFGIRIHLDCLEIKLPQLPETATRMRVSGLSYLNSKFEIGVMKTETFLKFTHLNDELVLKIDDDNDIEIIENFQCRLEKKLLNEINVKIKVFNYR